MICSNHLDHLNYNYGFFIKNVISFLNLFYVVFVCGCVNPFEATFINVNLFIIHFILFLLYKKKKDEPLKKVKPLKQKELRLLSSYLIYAKSMSKVKINTINSSLSIKLKLNRYNFELKCKIFLPLQSIARLYC